ncbi:hypothetical protein Vretifemale_7860, partial [Volvox reticuliferus]
MELVAFQEDKSSTARACWFITRRCQSSDEMWAGKVLGIYSYKSPLEKGKVDVILEAEWHAPLISEHGAGVAIDRYMNVPVVSPPTSGSDNYRLIGRAEHRYSELSTA